jgi:hypothetical protein
MTKRKDQKKKVKHDEQNRMETSMETPKREEDVGEESSEEGDRESVIRAVDQQTKSLMQKSQELSQDGEEE